MTSSVAAAMPLGQDEMSGLVSAELSFHVGGFLFPNEKQFIFLEKDASAFQSLASGKRTPKV